MKARVGSGEIIFPENQIIPYNKIQGPRSIISKFNSKMIEGIKCIYTYNCSLQLVYFFAFQMQHTQMDQKIRNLLFEPQLSLNLTNRDNQKSDSTGVPLGAIVEQLVSSTHLLHSELPHVDSLIKKAAMVKEMSTTDLKKYLMDEELELDIGKQRMVVEQRLGRQAKAKRQNIKYCSLIVEHSLYILWSHLDFYTMQANSRHYRSQGK